ncbi:SH3 domain and tetratricopeptide repeats-containing protein 1, partial [Ophiophagus hannah]
MVLSVKHITLRLTSLATTGFSVAVVSYEAALPDEISFQKGDKIEIIGYFMKCMPWFVGRRLSSGQVGFVQSSCVEPEGFLAIATE